MVRGNWVDCRQVLAWLAMWVVCVSGGTITDLGGSMGDRADRRVSLGCWDAVWCTGIGAQPKSDPLQCLKSQAVGHWQAGQLSKSEL